MTRLMIFDDASAQGGRHQPCRPEHIDARDGLQFNENAWPVLVSIATDLPSSCTSVEPPDPAHGLRFDPEERKFTLFFRRASLNREHGNAAAAKH
jgi:hypothetical protein